MEELFRHSQGYLENFRAATEQEVRKIITKHYDHATLLNKINARFGIFSNVLNWFKLYLTNRCQSVIIVICEWEWSVVGHLLFILYTDLVGDIAHKFINGSSFLRWRCSIICYFDPRNLSNDDIILLNTTMYSCNKMTEICNEFSKEFNVQFNTSKTKFMF